MSLAQSQAQTNGSGSDTDQTIRERIIHTLSIYPQLSPSMLQVGMGTSLIPALWKPVLEKMCEEGIVTQKHESRETPAGRQQSYTIIKLTEPTSE